jgi:hypothetical protein
LFDYINKTEQNKEHLKDNSIFRKPPNESYTYGKTIFTIYGISIDLEIMAIKRKLVYPFVIDYYII